jgi:hypothetical protein
MSDLEWLVDFFLLVVVKLFSDLKYVTIAGHRLQKLEGRIQYADVSFSYPSRPTV